MILLIRHLTLRTVKLVVRDIRIELLGKCFRLTRSWFTGTDLSRLYASIVQDTFQLDVMSNAIVAQLIPAMILAACLGVVLLWLNWTLFLLMIVIVPLLFLVRRLLKKEQSQRVIAYHRSRELLSRGIMHVL